MMNEPILQMKNLEIDFKTYAGTVKAVRKVSFDVFEGETLAIVGESGSGKSVTNQAIMKLLPQPPAIYAGGEILFGGSNLLEKSEKQMERIRGNEISMIFQDPMTSLNPTMKIGKQITEVMLKHKKISSSDARKRALELMDLVGIPNPKQRLKQYPHEFSGGMRQRVVIAIALAADPRLLIADEPTTALDVTIQAQILEVMKDVQKNSRTSIIFITHDLGVVANVADRVAVMYAGEIVEIGSVDDIFYNPQHPYTWGLLGSMPDMNADKKEELRTIPGSPPNLVDPPRGDAFAARNPRAMKIDFEKSPPMFEAGKDHYAKTWRLHPDAPKTEVPEIIRDRYIQYNGGDQ